MPEEPPCSVVVPTYRRPDRLRQCLTALLDQDVPPAEVLVVGRVDDRGTRAVVSELRRQTELVSLVSVDRPGVIAAMETGVRQASGDIVAFTDDDARPRADWLARLTAPFRDDSRIAGVGGRDNLNNGGPAPGAPTLSGAALTGTPTVGQLTWFGRVAGNHHLGSGPPRAVTVLKGVNCAYRRDVLEQVGFDHRLRGGGAQVHWELALGLALVRRGWRLLYDPAIVVDHDEEPRLDGQRFGIIDVEDQALADAAYNEALLLTEHLSGLRRLTYVLWSTVVGHRASPGLVQALRFTPELRRHSWRRWRTAARARGEARRGRRFSGSYRG